MQMKKAIVFEGGGILGAAQPVIMKMLENSGAITPKDFSVFCGTSAGAINALGYSLNIPSNELIELWKGAKEKDLVPKYWWSFLRGKRKNNIDTFIEEKMFPLASNTISKNASCKDIYDATGNEFYSVAAVIQNYKGLIFGHDWNNIKASEAVKFSTSHPLVFDTNEFECPISGKVLDLSDGGIVQNCPVGILMDRNDIDEVICISLNFSENENVRYTNFLKVITKILEGIPVRNELFSYWMAQKKWKEKFRLINFQVDDAIDIFDVSKIPYIMDKAIEMKGAETILQQSFDEMFPFEKIAELEDRDMMDATIKILSVVGEKK